MKVKEYQQKSSRIFKDVSILNEDHQAMCIPQAYEHGMVTREGKNSIAERKYAERRGKTGH
jgi:hypothetical protein